MKILVSRPGLIELLISWIWLPSPQSNIQQPTSAQQYLRAHLHIIWYTHATVLQHIISMDSLFQQLKTLWDHHALATSFHWRSKNGLLMLIALRTKAKVSYREITLHFSFWHPLNCSKPLLLTKRMHTIKSAKFSFSCSSNILMSIHNHTTNNYDDCQYS